MNGLTTTRRAALGFLGMGAVGSALWGVSRARFLDFLRADSESPEDFRVMRRPFSLEPGREISVLGYGGIRLPTLNGNKNQIDDELGLALVDYAYRHGINYFDTAWGYHNGEGARFFGRALKRYPRESFMLCNKMPPAQIKKIGDGASIFAEQLKRCQVDYFDTYLLHSVCAPDQYRFVYKNLGTLEYLKKEKESGRIRHLGFSFHGKSDFLERVLDDYPWELCLITLNAVYDRQVPDSARAIRVLQERKIPIFVMEPLGGGRCASLNMQARAILAEASWGSSPAEWAFRWALSHQGVQTVLSGMGRMSWLKDNIRTFSRECYCSMTEAEGRTYSRAIDAYMKYPMVPCTGCRYCVPCPYGVEIPELFSWWNQIVGEGRLPDDKAGHNSQVLRREFLVSYSHAVQSGCGPEKCIGCGKCIATCPQWVFNIPAEMKKISATIEKVRHAYVRDECL